MSEKKGKRRETKLMAYCMKKLLPVCIQQTRSTFCKISVCIIHKFSKQLFCIDCFFFRNCFGGRAIGITAFIQSKLLSEHIFNLMIMSVNLQKYKNIPVL